MLTPTDPISPYEGTERVGATGRTAAQLENRRALGHRGMHDLRLAHGRQERVEVDRAAVRRDLTRAGPRVGSPVVLPSSSRRQPGSRTLDTYLGLRSRAAVRRFSQGWRGQYPVRTSDPA